MNHELALAMLKIARRPQREFMAFGLVAHLGPENDYESIGTTRAEITDLMSKTIARWIIGGTMRLWLARIRQVSALGYTAQELGLTEDALEQAVLLAGIEDDSDTAVASDESLSPISRYYALDRIAEQVSQGTTSATELGWSASALQETYDAIMVLIADLCRQADPDALHVLASEAGPFGSIGIDGVVPISPESLGITPNEFEELVAMACRSTELLLELNQEE